MDQSLIDSLWGALPQLNQTEGFLPEFGKLIHLVNAAISLAYHRGLFDGAVAMFVAMILLMPTHRVIVVKGGPGNGEDH